MRIYEFYKPHQLMELKVLLSEIGVDSYTTYEDLPGNVKKMQESLSDATKIGSIKGYDLYQWNDLDNVNYGLFEDGNIVAFLCVTSDNEFNIPQIVFTWVRNNLRGSGLMIDLVNEFVNKNGSIYSDRTQSPPAKRMWVKILYMPSQYKKIIKDTDTGAEYDYDFRQHPEEDIWDGSHHYIVGLKK